MKDLLFGVAVLVVGVILTGAGHAPLGVPFVLFGAIFTWRGLRLFKGETIANQQRNQIADHADEIDTALQAGESPDQIAEAFETKYQIARVQTLKHLAMYALRMMGRGQDKEDTGTLLEYFTVHRADPLPSPHQVLEHLDPGRNLFGSDSEVGSHADLESKPVKGGLVATRTHLFFLPSTNQESLGATAGGEFLMSALPAAVGFLSMVKSLGAEIEAGLRGWNSPEAIHELKAWLARPGGFAVPWREMVGVRKDATPGRLADKVYLVLKHGDPAAPEVRRLSSGTDEAWVDDWIDVVRMAAVLEGRLLHL